MTFTEKQLREAAHCAAEAMADGFLDVPENEHEISPVFERKMEKLLRKMHRRPYVQTLQRAAAFFLAFLAAGSIWLSTDVQAREVFIGWVQEQYDRFQTHYFHKGVDTTNTEDIKYVLTEIPEGYEWETEIELTPGNVIYSYVNQDGYGLTFGYFTDQENGNLFIDTSNAEQTSVQMGEIIADFYCSADGSGSNMLVWVDENNVLLHINGWFSESEMVKIAKSIDCVPTN